LGEAAVGGFVQESCSGVCLQYDGQAGDVVFDGGDDEAEVEGDFFAEVVAVGRGAGVGEFECGEVGALCGLCGGVAVLVVRSLLAPRMIEHTPGAKALFIC
jgi:hypothetical protein